MKAILIALVFVAFIVVFVVFYIHSRNETFEGDVTDKKSYEEQMNNMNNNRPGITLGERTTTVYKIQVQTTAGKSIWWQVNEGKYETINVGDHVTKRSGTMDVDVTPKAAPPAVPTPPVPPAAPPSNPIV